MKRTGYMQLVMNHTYHEVPIRAIEQGTIEGVWEKAIAERLEKDYYRGVIFVADTLLDAGVWDATTTPTHETFLKAAYVIRKTISEEAEQ